ncbi:Alpha-ketoglutarate-dependent dioxygenase alkB 7, mitochondrial [Haplosporangium sp. Z 27]|nr:Alpha-ketoglutarate-dependent dioxygenase alkB 7, mitochondrial [Haplosporangium sp. Z 27]
MATGSISKAMRIPLAGILGRVATKTLDTAAKSSIPTIAISTLATRSYFTNSSTVVPAVQTYTNRAQYSTTHSNQCQSTLAYKDLCTPAPIAETHFDLSQLDPKEHAQVLRDFIIVPDYLSSKEHEMLVEAATKKLKRALGRQIRYEDGHFDGVITRYRECSASDWGGVSAPGSPTSLQPSLVTNLKDRATPQEVIESIKQQFFPSDWRWVAPHILELESGKGGIKPHVDHLDASGEVVAGLCLCSTAVMELIHQDDPKKQFRVLLPKGCFYFQRDSVRYNYKHGIPIQTEDHSFKGTLIPKEKRISIMLRVRWYI